RVNAGFSSVKIETEPTTKAVVTEANIPIATVCSSRFASTCSKNAECLINNVGKEECQCYSGFIGNGTICDDINECTMRMSKCLENATCVNTQGSFMCLCPKGQTGDGINYCGTAASTETEPINGLQVNFHVK
uniref:EGF-like domain-containing protein n=1 Tax=Romanomermis culicivorax TaxID=13658 RepID=A0A915HKA2_ROMCU